MTDLLKYINIKNPLFRFSLLMTLFGLVALADLLVPTSNPMERNGYILRFVLTFLTGGVVFYLVRYGFGIVAANPINFLVSTWIVFLLMHPTNWLWYFPIAIVSIALGKFIWRKNNLPVINPAAFALVITYVISVIVSMINPEIDMLLVSWWGADMFQNMTQNIPVLNVVVPLIFLLSFLYYANVFKKIPYVLSFFLTFILLTISYISLNDSFDKALSVASLMLFNATAFCAMVMIPEPKTSPNFPKQQLIVGIIAGAALWLFNTILITWPIDPLINAVIVANLATFGVKMMAQRPKPIAPVVQVPTTILPQ